MLEKMKNYIADTLNVDVDEIEGDTSLRDDLGADSLDLYELVLNLQDEYSIEIPVEDLQAMDTVNDVIAYLTSHGIEE